MEPSLRQLVIDIGNSGIKGALFTDGRLQLPVVRLASDDWSAVNQLATNYGADFIIYSSVANVPPDDWIEHWENTVTCRVYALDRSRPLPFTSAYRSVDTLGQDRIAAVAGTLPLAEGPCLIVDAGSCITYDLVVERHHLGGNISPGIGMRLRAMHAFTARLPRVALDTSIETVGRDTEAALRSGGLLGAVYELEGMVDRLRASYPDLAVVLTGGDAPRIAAETDLAVDVRPHLVLQGLHQILTFYVNSL